VTAPVPPAATAPSPAAGVRDAAVPHPDARARRLRAARRWHRRAELAARRAARASSAVR
jgi:hypothetical protein